MKKNSNAINFLADFSSLIVVGIAKREDFICLVKPQLHSRSQLEFAFALARCYFYIIFFFHFAHKMIWGDYPSEHVLDLNFRCYIWISAFVFQQWV